MSEVENSQEVGLEAATLERVRNSSLVENSGADNVTGLSHVPKLRQCVTRRKPTYWVGERRYSSEAAGQPSRGRVSSENAGMSSERGGRNPSAECPRVPGEGSSAQGKSGPKARPRGVVDGQQVDIPVPVLYRLNPNPVC
jgi:hypothetical protein